MDTFNIFCKLSKGAKFSKATTVDKNASNESNKAKIKEESKTKIKLEEDCVIDSDSEETTKKDDYNFNLEDEISRFRNNHNIAVKGTGIPPPIRSFHELDTFEVSQQIIANVMACGYSDPTPIQMQAIPVMLNSRQILACAPTGSGKTAAFLIPVLSSLKKPSRKGFRALILCPTRELARQTFRECVRLTEKTGMKPHIITKVKQDKFGPNFSMKFDILISTPNRLIYLLKQENQILSLNNVEWLVVDESDKLFETGKRGFRDQLAEIYKSCNNKDIKRAMFSATYTPQVAGWCKKNLKNVVSVTVGHRNTTVQDVEQELIYVGDENGKLLAFRDLIQAGINPPVLVFVESKDRAKQLFNELILDQINVDVIHSDRSQLQRDNVVCAFREGKIWVLICTELMGRGIDFKGVKLVINYDFPPSAISYIHRIGRTGRAGRPGKAITYFTKDDKLALRSIASVMKESGCDVPSYMLKLKKLKKSEKSKLKKDIVKRAPITTSVRFKKRKRKNSDASTPNETVSNRSFKKQKGKNLNQSLPNGTVNKNKFKKQKRNNLDQNNSNEIVNKSFKKHKRKNTDQSSPDETVSKQKKNE
ncbi:probable ATP-dependent RNA helicase DDX52 [Halyomorpha halys]|uniref:probable ATP-dependent RNA helicase DDX52 n=1 Tax=Halyomorpha halys TaxID=286706 RepID=UPI0006D4D3E2|nr:probable ATP-dependent RNA helicase DDX52 [Halyomorpha halys]